MITADDARNMARFLEEKKELWENVKNQIEAAAIRGLLSFAEKILEKELTSSESGV